MKKSFSIIEVSAVILLIAVIASGLLSVVNNGFFFVDKSRQRTAAYLLAQEVIERYYDWSALPANGTYVNPLPYPVTINRKIYNVTLQISDAPVYAGSIKQIGVTIAWGNERFSLVSFKANY